MALTLAYTIRPGFNGYAIPGVKARSVKDMQAARRVYAHARDQSDLSPQQFGPGHVIDANGVHIATITYSGAVRTEKVR